MKLSKSLFLIPAILTGCAPNEKTGAVEPPAANNPSEPVSEAVGNANKIEALREALSDSIASRDAQALLSLYYTDGLDHTSLEMLRSSIERRLDETKRWKSYSVSHVETLDFSDFGSATDGERIAYYPTKYLSSALHLSHDYKERSGRGMSTFPILQVEGKHYLAARKIQDLPGKAEKKFYSISLKDDHHQVFAPLFVTYAVGDYIQMRELPGRQGQLSWSKLLSVSCPPIPTAEKATLLVVNAQNEDEVLLELEFNPQQGLYWHNTDG